MGEKNEKLGNVSTDPVETRHGVHFGLMKLHCYFSVLLVLLEIVTESSFWLIVETYTHTRVGILILATPR